MLRSFVPTEAPKNYLKMLLFSTSAVAVWKGYRNEKKMADKFIREEIYIWGLYIFIYNTFSVYGHFLSGVIME